MATIRVRARVERESVACQSVDVQVTLPDGTMVLAQGRLDLVPSDRPREPDFAMYLDRRWDDDPHVTWPFRLIGWEDFGLPVDEAEVFTAIADLYRRAQAGELVEVACYGGVGRTGTVLGCLTVLAGVEPSDAVAWVRGHYHPSAIETSEQEQFIARFAKSPSGP
jgi:protein tyrosine phosphatase